MELDLTPSKAEELQACAFAFQQKYLAKNVKVGKIERTPPVYLGNIVHSVLDIFYKRGGYAQLEKDDLLTLLDQKWDGSVYTNYEQEVEHRHLAKIMLSDFYDSEKDAPPVRERQTEKFYQVERLKLGNHRLEVRGKFDRLDLFPDGSVEIVDFKTNQPQAGLPDERELGESLANLLYYRLATALYPQTSDVVISHHYLVSKRKVSVRYTAGRFAAAKNHLLELLDKLETGVAPPTENQGCAWCLVKRGGKCPRFKPIS